MTVAELIKELQDLCEDRNPETVEVKKVEDCPTFGADYIDFWLETAGGNVYPFVILVK